MGLSFLYTIFPIKERYYTQFLQRAKISSETTAFANLSPYSILSAIEQHLKSGVHESSRYECKKCSKGFYALASLQEHLRKTGHHDTESRLLSTAIYDFKTPGNMLLLTDGRSPSSVEATLYFDGGARPNPGRLKDIYYSSHLRYNVMISPASSLSLSSTTR